MTIGSIDGPQGRLALNDEPGPGPAVLFVHGDAGNQTQWREALDHLRTHRRAIAFDLRGSGQSALPADNDYSYAGRSDDIGAVVHALNLGACILVAHSGGGVAALHYAAEHPERVRALLLVDPAGDGRRFPEAQRRHFLELLDGPTWRDTLRDYYTSIAGPNPAVRDRVLRDAAAAPQAAVLGGFRALSQYDPTPALAQFRGRRLSLVTSIGENPAALHHLDTDLPHQPWPIAGHWPHLDDPPAFHRIMDEFIG